MIKGRWMRRLAAPVLLMALAAVAFAACGDDDDDSGNDGGGSNGPTVSNATAMFTRADLGAVHLTITGGDEDDELLSASTGIAGMVQVHETVTQGAGSSMQEVDKVEIHADETVTFEPGGYHIMLMDVTEALAEGDTFPLELTFAKAGTITVDVTVETVLSSDDSDSGNGSSSHDNDSAHDNDEDHADDDH